MMRVIYFILFFSVFSHAVPIVNFYELSYLLKNIDYYLNKPSEPVFVILKENHRKEKKIDSVTPRLKTLPRIEIGVSQIKPTIKNSSKIVHFSKKELQCIKQNGQKWIDANMSQIDIAMFCKK